MKITNFGGNVQFEPKHWYAPKNEREVLDILNRHAHGKIRVMASGHAWSDIAKSQDVTIDMQNISQVEVERKENGEVWARAGAGCVLQRLLDTIHAMSDYTLPTMGGIKKQTIAGVISTGTHGSGRPSLSHYMQEIRVAAYDETGKAKIYTYTQGDELRAARCGLGCMGVILSVKFQCVPKYYVAQSLEYRGSLEQILAEKEQYELQQFILVPYCWRWYVYTRRVSAGPPTGVDWLFAHWIRIYSLFGTDILLHLVLKTVVIVSFAEKGMIGPIRWFFGAFVPKIIERRKTANDFHEEALTLRHDLFGHLEMELFVPERTMQKAMEAARHVTAVFAGTEEEPPPGVKEELQRIGKLDELMRRKGFFTHHYPLYCRQVKLDDTLVSMTAGAKEWYFSLSFFTYLAPGKRERFYEFSKFMASCLVQLYEARLHWGKYFPLQYEDIKHLYPRLGDFRAICQKSDPHGVFRNEYTTKVLGFP
ncbi:MAG TPA: D-arabinono-1,4-lactone oxidase [Candidatus Paceibacterota bacterium]